MTAGTADGNWRDLSGSEVRQRLERRGVEPELAALWWRQFVRQDPSAERLISARLEQ